MPPPFAVVLAELMRQRRLSPESLAEMSRLSLDAIKRYPRGKRTGRRFESGKVFADLLKLPLEEGIRPRTAP